MNTNRKGVTYTHDPKGYPLTRVKGARYINGKTMSAIDTLVFARQIDRYLTEYGVTDRGRIEVTIKGGTTRKRPPSSQAVAGYIENMLTGKGLASR